MNMTMTKRFFKLFKSNNKTYMNCYPKFYKLDKFYSEKTNYIYFNKCKNRQQFNFYSTMVANSTLLSSHALENEILNLCISLRNGRVLLEHLKQIIQIYDGTDIVLPNDIGLTLLKCCGNSLPDVDLSTRQKLTNQVWNLLQKKDCQITLEHYNCLLEIYAQNLESINPHEFLDKMTVEPDQSIYCSLLNVISKTENLELATDVISTMKENTWNIEIFNMIVKVYAMQGNIEEANNVIQKMKSYDIVPSSNTYIYLAYGYAKTGNISNVTKTFEKYRPSVTNIVEVIKILSQHGHGEHIESILKFLPESLKLTELSFITNAITELIYADDRINARRILFNLPSNLEITDTCVEYVKHFINKDIQLNKSDEDILQVIHDITDHKYSPFIINEVTKIAMHNGRESLALTLLEYMKEKDIPIRSHYYWPLLLQTQKHADDDKLYSLLSHMISLNVEIDKDTLIEYVLPFIDETDPIKIANTLIQKEIKFYTVIKSISAFLLHKNRLNDLLLLLSKLKVKLNFCDSNLQKSLVQGFEKTDNMSDYVSLMLKIPYSSEPPYLYILNALLGDVIESKTMKRLIDFLQILKKHKVKLSKLEIDIMTQRIVDVFAVDTVEVKTVQNLLKDLSDKEIDLSLEKDALTKKQSSSVLCLDPHPAKMDIENLFNHVIELKSKNMNIRGTTKKLLYQYCNQNDLKAAEKIKEEIISNNFEWTPGMRAKLFQLYVKNDLLDKAEIELNEILTKFSEFKLDTSKILAYAISLVKNNRLEDTFNLINNIKNINNSQNTIDSCLNLLFAITKSEHPDDTEKMLITLSKNKYCNFETILFSPLIERHLLTNDVETAIDTFIYCVNKYKKTPLKQKLLHILIDNYFSLPNVENKLKQILKCINDIYGEPVTVVTLIMALGESGKVPEIRKIFQIKDVRMKLLIHNILSKDNKLDISLKIFEAIKDMKNVGIDHLCDLILSIYDQRNDYKGGAAFLKEMEAASVTPSKKYMNKFGNFVAQ